MPSSKKNISIFICLALLISIFGLANAREFSNGISQNLPSRDNDNYMTYRYMMSEDGGASWSEVYHTGDHGMWAGTPEDVRGHAWNMAAFNYGAVVDLQSKLHIIAPLTAFNPDLNPLQRRNGLYDINIHPNGEVRYTLIYPQVDLEYVYADAGKDHRGNVVAVYQVVYEEGGEFFSRIEAIFGARGNDWQDNPVVLAEGLQVDHVYPRITTHIGDYLFVLYQQFNEQTGNYDHYVVQADFNLAEVEEPEFTGLSTDNPYSYSLPAANPIDFDRYDNYVYFTVLSDTLSDPIVAGKNVHTGEWTIDTLETTSGVPSMMLYLDEEQGGTPWVLSTGADFMIGEPDFTWYTYCGIGYGFDDYISPAPLDSVLFDGSRYFYNCHQAVQLSGGRIVSGANHQGAYQAEGFSINYTDNGGITWNGNRVMWTIEETGFAGTSLSHTQLIEGPDDSVYLVFTGAYGSTDLVPPRIANIDLSSYTIGESWVVTANIGDEDSEVGETHVFYTNENPREEDTPWLHSVPDSCSVGENYTTCYFSIPSDEIMGRQIAEGDTIWFKVGGSDEFGNTTITLASNIIANVEWNDVAPERPLPSEFALDQNYPNPFNSSTVIPFSLNTDGKVDLKVTDMNGRLVAQLLNTRLQAGEHLVQWEAQNITTGVYFYQLTTPSGSVTMKMILMR